VIRCIIRPRAGRPAYDDRRGQGSTKQIHRTSFPFPWTCVIAGAVQPQRLAGRRRQQMAICNCYAETTILTGGHRNGNRGLAGESNISPFGKGAC
jgi:hypothetical protein